MINMFLTKKYEIILNIAGPDFACKGVLDNLFAISVKCLNSNIIAMNLLFTDFYTKAKLFHILHLLLTLSIYIANSNSSINRALSKMNVLEFPKVSS